MKMLQGGVLLLWGLMVWPVGAESILMEGVLGNSGTDGKTLVRFGGMDFRQNGRDSGLAYDRLGGLWSFGGTGKLLRYAADGRMTASFPLKDTPNDNRSLVLVGDTLLIRLEAKMYRLPITAADGTAPELLKTEAQALSLNSEGGQTALATRDNKVGLYDPAADAFTEKGQWIDVKDKPSSADLMPDGSIVINGAWRFPQSGGAMEKVALPLRSLHQVVGNYVYGFDFHMTLSRWNLKFEPDPGVVFGGSAGYFIGSLPEDGELVIPRGMAHLSGTRYAVLGPLGVIHLLEWNVDKQAFDSLRRLGPVHFPAALALDARGRVWFYSGFWEWNDGPDHILRSATNFSSRDWNQFQSGVLSGGQLAFPFLFRATPSLMHRPFDEDDKTTSSEIKNLPKNPTGLAVLPKARESEVLVVDREGKGTLIPMANNGKPKKGETPIALQLLNASGALTSLGVTKEGDLLAADGGFVVVLKREGDSFKEVSRWNTWGQGPDEKFGAEIYLDASDGHLWVSDTRNNRVVHFTLEGTGSTGPSIYTGAGLETPLAGPKRIDASGEKAVVMDSGNQRIVKLSLQK